VLPALRQHSVSCLYVELSYQVADICSSFIRFGQP
jgi:hypothetical protein